MRLTTLLALLVVPALALANDEDKKGAREIKVKEVESVGRPGRMAVPRKIESAAEFEKSFSGAGVKDVLKEVDFTKEYVVAFTWGGSGQDKIDFSTEKDEVTFKYTPGRTRDLRGHVKVFALPKNATYKMSK